MIQPLVETHLREALDGLTGVQLRTGHEVQSMVVGQDAVKLYGRCGGDADFRVSARFVVGCDGGESLVRASLGARLEGSYRSERWLIVDAVDRQRAPDACNDILVLGGTPRAVVTVPRKHGHRRWEFQILAGESDEAMLGDDAIARLIADCGGDARYEVLRRIVYCFRAGNASRYGAQRVFIAGDAAHVMPPYAGQGLSCGLHDVANLSWRLWLVTRHGADLRLLEDYDLERRPVNRAAIALSVFNRVLVAPDTALRRGLRDTVLGLINAVPGGARRLSQLQLRPFRLYGQGTIVVNGGLRKHVGQILPQWRTQTRRGRQALDDVLGPGFSLIAFGDVSWTSCDASALAFWGDLGAQRLTIPAEEVADMDGELTRFMAPLMGHIAVVRPDRIIMAVCRANRLAQVTELCRQLLTGH